MSAGDQLCGSGTAVPAFAVNPDLASIAGIARIATQSGIDPGPHRTRAALQNDPMDAPCPTIDSRPVRAATSLACDNLRLETVVHVTLGPQLPS